MLSPIDVDLELVCINMLLSIDTELLPINVGIELPPGDIDIELQPVDINLELSPINIDIELPPADIELVSVDIQLPINILLPIDSELPLISTVLELPPIRLDMELQPFTIMMLLSSLNWDIEPLPANVDFELVRINMLLSVDIELLPIYMESQVTSISSSRPSTTALSSCPSKSTSGSCPRTWSLCPLTCCCPCQIAT